MREALEQLALLRFARLIVGQLSSISSLSLIPTIHSFSSLRVQRNTHGVLANSDSSQAMTPSKQKRTHAVFRASSAHRSTSTSKPRFVGERVKLGEVVGIEKAPIPSGNNVWLLNLDAIEKDTGRVLEKNRISPDSVGTSTIAFTENAVLYSKLRPNLNKVVVADEPGLATSEILPLISKSEVLDRRYLAFLLRSKAFVKLAASSTAGSKMPRLNKKTLLEAVFPLPDPETQRWRVELLTSIEKEREKAELQIANLDSLVKSRFVEMFGDLEHGYKCSSCKLGLIAEVGSSKRVFKNELLAEGVPFYRGTEIADLSAGGPIKPSLFISKEHYERLIGSTGKPEIGDLLLPSICPDGQIWCVNTNAPFYFKDGRVLWIRPDRDAVDGVYLRHALSTMFQMSFSNIASGTTFAELKIFLLKELNVPLPELKAQKEFVSFATQVDKSRFIAQQQIEKLQMLYDSLAQDYFGD